MSRISVEGDNQLRARQVGFHGLLFQALNPRRATYHANCQILSCAKIMIRQRICDWSRLPATC